MPSDNTPVDSALLLEEIWSGAPYVGALHAMRSVPLFINLFFIIIIIIIIIIAYLVQKS
jgi:hypothetical protein